MEQQKVIINEQLKTALSMLYCPENNKAVFFCISDKCHKGLSPLVCNSNGCKACLNCSKQNNGYSCKKQRLLLIESFLEKIVEKQEKMLEKQIQCVQNTIKYFDQIIQLISAYRQNFQKLSHCFGLSYDQFCLLQGIKSGNLTGLSHQFAKKLFQNMNFKSYFNFLDISEVIGAKILYETQNSFQYFYNQNVPHSYVNVPYNKSHSYDFKEFIIPDTLDKLDKDAIQLSFNFKLTQKQFQSVTSNFKKLKKLSVMDSNIMDFGNILKLQNLDNLNQLLIEKDKQKKTEISEDYMLQILKNSHLKKVVYDYDFSKPLQDLNYNAYFKGNSQKFTMNKYYSLYPMGSSSRLNKLQYWLQNSQYLKQNKIENQNLKFLCIFANIKTQYFVRKNIYKKIYCSQNLLVLQLQGLKFQQSPKKWWESMKNLTKLTLYNCQNINQQILDDIGISMGGITQLQIFTQNFTQKRVSLHFLSNLKSLKALSLMFYSQINDELQVSELEALAQIKSLRLLNLIDFQGFNENWMNVIKKLVWIEHLLISCKSQDLLLKFNQFQNLDTLETLVIKGQINNANYISLKSVQSICKFRNLKNISINIPIDANKTNILTRQCKRIQSLAINNVPQKEDYSQSSNVYYNSQWVSTLRIKTPIQTKRQNTSEYKNLYKLKRLKFLRVAYNLNQKQIEYFKRRNVQLVNCGFRSYIYPLKFSEIQRLRKQQEKKIQQKERQKQQKEQQEQRKKLKRQQQMNQQRNRIKLGRKYF